MSDKWWERPFRTMRFDWLSEMEKVKNSNLDKLAKSVRKDWHCNVEWIMATPGCAPGGNFEVAFDSDKFEKMKSVGSFDYARDYLPYARKYGIKLLAYLNLHWYSYASAKGREGWQQTMADGKIYGEVHPLYGGGTTYCVNSPWRKVAGELISEAMKTGIDGVFLDGPLVYPDCCYCRYCRDKFKLKYHQEIPAEENWKNDPWKSFVEFREDSMAKFLKDMRAEVKKVNPDGVIYLNAGSWHGSGWRAAGNIEKVGQYQDVNGTEAFNYLQRDERLYASSSVAKYMSAGDKPAVVFTHHALGGWHYNPLPPFEIKLAIAQTAACGANPWFAVFNPALEQGMKECAEPVKEIQGFLEENEEYYEETEALGEIALHYSTQTQQFYLSELKNIFQDFGSGKEQNLVQDLGTGEVIINQKKCKEICEEHVRNTFYGYFLMLTRRHFQFSVVLDSVLTSEKLKQYKTLILPNSACLSSSQAKAVIEYVKNGGRLIASFETGNYDARGNKQKNILLSKLLGIQKVDEVFTPSNNENYIKVKQNRQAAAGLRKDQLIPRPTYALKIKPGKKDVDSPCVFMTPINRSYACLQGESEYPAVLTARFGRGRVVYLPCLLGQFYERFKINSIEDLLEGAVNWAGGSRPILKTDAPPTVEIELRTQERHRRVLVHLINLTGDMQRPIKKIVPLSNINISLKGKPPKRIYRLSDKKPVRFKAKKGFIDINIDTLDFYEVVVIEKRK